MKKLRQFDTLVIEELTKEEFHQPTHGQTYYEVIYIFSGEGIHHLNTTRTAYQADDLFFVSPEDTHFLEIKSVTHFGVIKFTDSYFKENQNFMLSNMLQNRPELMMKNKAFKEQKLVTDDFHRQQIRRTIQNLIEWQSGNGLDRSPFVFFQILSVFGIFQEAWIQSNRLLEWEPTKESLISYIHAHVYDPERIRIKSVADTFHISPHYFSNYFKTNFGISYRQYINNYRIKLIESRIKSGLSQRQIADEFGFNDESHLSHFFKKQQAMSFRDYRTGASKEKT